jgi:hypothetical protein
VNEKPSRPIDLNVVNNGTGLLVTPALTEPFILTTKAVDGLIRALIGLRAGMVPAHAPPEPGGGIQALVHEHMQWAVQPNSSGGITLLVLHPGAGWIALPLDLTGSKRMLARMAQCLPAPGSTAKN